MFNVVHNMQKSNGNVFDSWVALDSKCKTKRMTINLFKNNSSPFNDCAFSKKLFSASCCQCFVSSELSTEKRSEGKSTVWPKAKCIFLQTVCSPRFILVEVCLVTALHQNTMLQWFYCRREKMRFVIQLRINLSPACRVFFWIKLFIVS